LLERVPFLHLRFTTAGEWRQKAKAALILSGAESQQASVPTLFRLSQDADAGVRMTAVDYLSRLVFIDPRALPALEAAQVDADAQVRNLAQDVVREHSAVSNAVQRLREMRPRERQLVRFCQVPGWRSSLQRKTGRFPENPS
jgi:HEAT repeat protein